MNQTKQGIIFLLLAGVLLLALSVHTYPITCNSFASVAYNESNTKQGSTSDSIEGMIIVAAGYFFEGRAGIQQLLTIIELQDTNGINSATLDTVVKAALVNMQKSRDTYLKIVARASSTSYNMATLALLKSFPYNELRVREGLNQTIFTRIVKSLQNGDVTGIFRRNVQQMNTLIKLLKQIKLDFNAGRVPAIALFWQLNETAAEAALSGSYVARVFARVK